MNFISFLSTQIEKGAIFLNELTIVILPFLEPYLLNHPEAIMITIGFGGQALFATRFIIQWISSENAGKSIIPIAFWYFSISGGQYPSKCVSAQIFVTKMLVSQKTNLLALLIASFSNLI